MKDTWRNKIILSLFFLLAATIVCRLIYLQVIQGKFYKSQALGQQAGFKEIKGERGEVFFGNSRESHGNIASLQINNLAINEDRWLISAVPLLIKNKIEFADILSKELKKILGADQETTKEFILSKLEKSNSYVILKKDLSVNDVSVLIELKLEGLSLEASPGRYYPQEELASNIIGFFGGADAGQYGIEGYYDEILRGKEGISEQKKGFNIITATDSSSLNGADIYLTIDHNIQFQAESLLREAYKNISIESGQIIVMKPDSGRILAMANFPSFDPNAYFQENDLEIFQNATVQKIFEPGSIFKPFIMGMALNEGKVTPDSTFVDTGNVKIGPDTIYNFNREKYGERDMSGILEKSINTGVVFLSKMLPHDTFLDYLDKLGFNDKTGIDLQGEVSSRNEILRSGSDFGFATASFGQGIEMTPIQLVSAFSIFANGGKMVKPYVVEKIVQGQTETITKPHISREIISPLVASQVSTMLTNVVERGFGDGAKIKGYYLAGKTGTAEVPLESGRGYYKDKTVQSFIGFGPSLKPEFLILVKLDNPKVSRSALSAVPIFKKLSQFIINYWQIPPDYEGG